MLDKSAYITRLHCHQKALVMMAEHALRAETPEMKRTIEKRIKAMKKDILIDRKNYVLGLHPLSADILSEMYAYFTEFISTLLNRYCK